MGQGDAVLVRSGWGRAVIIDGGGVPGAAASGGFDVGDRRVVPALKRLGVRRLEAVLNTHPHEDHVHGLAAVIAQREVNGVFAAEIEGERCGLPHVSPGRGGEGAPRAAAEGRDELVLEPGLSLVVLAAGTSTERAAGAGRPSTTARRCSLLAPAGSALFPGDIEERGQRRLLAQEAGRGELALLRRGRAAGAPSRRRVTAFTGLLPAARPKIGGDLRGPRPLRPSARGGAGASGVPGRLGCGGRPPRSGQRSGSGRGAFGSGPCAEPAGPEAGGAGGGGGEGARRWMG